MWKPGLMSIGVLQRPRMSQVWTWRRANDMRTVTKSKIWFHNLSWITEINELFHYILIYWDAPVYLYSILKYIILLIN